MMRRLLSTLAMAALLGGLIRSAALAADYSIVPTIPLQGDHVETARPTIAFQIHSSDATNPIPQNAVHLFIDDQEVSDGLQVEGANLAFVPQEPLPLGPHAIRVTVDDGSGGAIGYSWNFTIDADDEQPAPDQAQQYHSAPYGSLEPTGDQFGYGDDAGFYFSGAPGGNGYLTFAGFPGIYPLIGVYGFPNLYYASFPVPYGYYGNAPGVTCWFTGPGGTVSTYHPTRPVAFVPNGAPSNRRFITSGLAHPPPVEGPAINVTGGSGSRLRFEPPSYARPSAPTGFSTTTSPAPGSNAQAIVPSTGHGYGPGGSLHYVPVGTSGQPSRGYAAPQRVYAPPRPPSAPIRTSAPAPASRSSSSSSRTH